MFANFNKEFVFPDPEPPIITILYRWSGICGQVGLCSSMFSFATKLIIFVLLYHIITLLHSISCFSLNRSLLVPYSYFSIESIDYILLSSFELKAILIISSVKALCCSIYALFLILIYCFLWILYDLYKDHLCQFYIFLDCSFYSRAELCLNSFYNFDI